MTILSEELYLKKKSLGSPTTIYKLEKIFFKTQCDLEVGINAMTGTSYLNIMYFIDGTKLRE